MLFVALLSVKPGGTFQEGGRPQVAMELPGRDERLARDGHQRSSFGRFSAGHPASMVKLVVPPVMVMSYRSGAPS